MKEIQCKGCYAVYPLNDNIPKFMKFTGNQKQRLMCPKCGFDGFEIIWTNTTIRRSPGLD